MAISSLFFFFFFFFDKKISHAHVRSLCRHEKLLPLLFSVSLFLFFSWFLLVTCFCAREIFLSKEISRLEIVMITSFYYTTLLYYYREFICMCLFLFVIMCEDLFFLWESFWIFFYLWLSLRIYFLKPLWK